MNQVSAFDKLKKACAKKSYKSFDSLDVGEYLVKNFTLVDTTYGKRVRITMDDSTMYLPERFAEILDETAIFELNAAPMIMIYSGKQNKRLLIDFKPVEYADQQLTFGFKNT